MKNMKLAQGLLIIAVITVFVTVLTLQPSAFLSHAAVQHNTNSASAGDGDGETNDDQVVKEPSTGDGDGETNDDGTN